jgi:23S rRNA (adenine-N6)-dimethyltransferase
VDAAHPRGGRPARGQHLLRSEVLAEELVYDASVGRRDVVLEIGAGKGLLTAPLAAAARQVIAVEIDEAFIRVLKRRFPPQSRVDVRHADILDVPFPAAPFRAFGNLPFSLTTSILRRLLDDPSSTLTRADLIVQHEVARKRASVWPGNLVTLAWLPWWELRAGRHLHATAFEPRPSVDASLLVVTRRARPLLPAQLLSECRSLLAPAFRRGNLPLERALGGRVDRRVLRRFVRQRCLPRSVRPIDLDVTDWVALVSSVTGSLERHGRPGAKH